MKFFAGLIVNKRVFMKVFWVHPTNINGGGIVRFFSFTFVVVVGLLFSQLSIAQGGDLVGGKGTGLSPYEKGYGLSPADVRKFNMAQKWTKKIAVESAEADNQKKAIQLLADPQRTKQMQELMFDTQSLDCKGRLQALVRSTPGVQNRDFVMKGGQVIYVSEGKTYVYNSNALTVVDGRACTHDDTKKVADGVRAIFETTLPKADAPKGPLSAKDKSVLKRVFKEHVGTLLSCRNLVGDDYVAQTIEKWGMTDEKVAGTTPGAATSTR